MKIILENSILLAEFQEENFTQKGNIRVEFRLPDSSYPISLNELGHAILGTFSTDQIVIE